MNYANLANWLRGKIWMGPPIGICIWAVWIISLGIGGWESDAMGTVTGVDHLAFYSAAHLIREGRAAEMYNYDETGNYQGQLLGREWGQRVAFRNPPFYALLYLATAGFPFFDSVLIWTVLGLILLTIAVHLVASTRPWKAVGWAMSFYPTFAVVSFGQNTFLSLAIFAGVYHLLRIERRFAAGLAAGLLWFKPQLIIGLLIWWCVSIRRYHRCLAGSMAMGMVLAAISFVVLPDASEAFIETLANNIGYGGENGWNKESPRAFWQLLLPNADPKVILTLTLICAAAGIAALVLVIRRAGEQLGILFPTVIFVTLWISPHTLIYEWALLVPAAIILWECQPDRRNPLICLFILGWLSLAVSTPLALLQISVFKSASVVQFAVPIVGLAGFLGIRELTRPIEARPPISSFPDILLVREQVDSR